MNSAHKEVLIASLNQATSLVEVFNKMTYRSSHEDDLHEMVKTLQEGLALLVFELILEPVPQFPSSLIKD